MTALIKRRMAGHRTEDVVYLVDSRKESKDESLSPEDEAVRIVDEARVEAACIIDEARGKAEDTRLAAYREGRAAADAELAEEKAALVSRMAELDEEALRQAELFWRSAEPELLKLSIEIARKIIRREVEANDDFVLDAIKAGLHQMSSRHQLKIRANSADCELIREHRDELVGSFDGISSVEVIEDRRVPQGGWIVESDSGRLDGRIESQLKEVDRCFTEAARDA